MNTNTRILTIIGLVFFQFLWFLAPVFAQNVGRKDVEETIKNMILKEKPVLFLMNSKEYKYLEFPIQEPQILLENFSIKNISDVHRMSKNGSISYLPPGGIRSEKTWMALATLDPFTEPFKFTHSSEAYIMCTINDSRYFVTVELSEDFRKLMEKMFRKKLNELGINFKE